MLIAEVGSFDVNYAFDQEFGPYGKPYLRPAMKAEATLDKINKRIRDYYR